jgi:hypothetical protein
MRLFHLSAAGVALVAIAGFLLAEPSPAADAVDRAYTPLDLDKCRHRPGREVEDYGSWQCSGFNGMAVRVTAGDQRTTVSFGPNAAREVAASETLAAFNSTGKTIEWRIERASGGKLRPFAAILRWNTTTLDDAGHQVRGQVLVVTRVLRGGVCHVGYVDGRANSDANALAVEIADGHARTFKCGSDKPIVRGVQGPGFSGPYGN